MTDSDASRKSTVSDDPGDEAKKKGKASQAKLLMDLAEEHLTICRNREGRAMVASNRCRHLFHPLATNGCEPLSQLFVAFHASHDKVPSRNARIQLVDMLSFEADLADARDVSIRCSHLDDVIWLDTGWPSGEVIRVGSDGWSVETSGPCSFTRGQVTGPFPDPREVEPDLSALGNFINCSERDLPLVYAALLTSWFNNVPQPVLSLFGPADAGKTTALQFLVDLADPSTTQAGGSLDVKDVRAIKALAGTRRVFVLDNLSNLNASESDMVAKIATGGELITRMLYTDDQAHVTQLLRPVWMNGIMDGVARSDLASRLVVIRLDSLNAEQRASSSALLNNWARSRASIFGGLLDLLVDVLRLRDTISEEHCDFRMVEFQRNLRAIDAILGTEGEQRLLGQAQELSDIVLDSTPLGEAFKAAVACSRSETCPVPCFHSNSLFATWELPALRDLLTEHTQEAQRRYLPSTSEKWGQALTRIQGDLRVVLQIDFEKTRTSEARLYTFVDLAQ